MKETKNVTIATCDQCKKTVTDEGNKTFGGSIFSGWYKVEEISGSTDLTSLTKRKIFDLCSIECLKNFVDEKLKIKN